MPKTARGETVAGHGAVFIPIQRCLAQTPSVTAGNLGTRGADTKMTRRLFRYHTTLGDPTLGSGRAWSHGPVGKRQAGALATALQCCASRRVLCCSANGRCDGPRVQGPGGLLRLRNCAGRWELTGDNPANEGPGDRAVCRPIMVAPGRTIDSEPHAANRRKEKAQQTRWPMQGCRDLITS